MRHLKVTLAYDGTSFQGWQVQKTGRTVEGEIRKALERMHKHPVNIHAAGRTDSGVHATGQVISYTSDLDSIPGERYARALNSFFPLDIRAKLVDEVPSDFHARHDARERSYKYYLFVSDVPEPHYRLYSDRIVHRPDIRFLNRLAAAVVGTHDFTTFSAPSEQVPDKIRTVYAASFHSEGPFIVFSIRGASFLWRMVRSIVGSLLSYEQEGMDAQEVANRLKAADRNLAGPTAPAWGLFLDRVRYDNETRLF